MPDALTETEHPPLSGAPLVICAALLALGNLVAVLDITIANVSIPNIAGGLAVSSSQGTWVITSYGIAEAITVPLTGWLSRSFGQVRTFCCAMLSFGVFSALCGAAHSFYLLVFLRVLQGLAGGPMIPLSQVLLLRVFPKSQAQTAGTIWTLGSSAGPVLGPLLGGYLCDRFSWPWIFYVNVPTAFACAGAVWLMLGRNETRIRIQRIDAVGLGLLVTWVGALQLMLDRGQELDWFGSPFIVGCALTTAIGFASFLIWELTDEAPIVDLTVFRNRGYTLLVATLCLGYGAFFASVVLSPLWMQTNLGYTALRAAMAVCPAGLVIILLASTVQRAMSRVDKRILISAGAGILAAAMAWRSTFASNVAFHSIIASHIAMGAGLAFFVIPIFSTVLSTLPAHQIPAGASLMSFLRTTAGAFAASLVTTAWQNAAATDRETLVNRVSPDALLQAGASVGLSPIQALHLLDATVNGQGVMLATNQVYFGLAAILGAGACAVWLAPRDAR